MQNKHLKTGQKLLLPSGTILFVQKINIKTKQITLKNLMTGEIHKQGLDMYFHGHRIE